MPRQKTAQLNIRSPYVRERVAEIAKQTGMTATEVIEDAIRGYVPPGGPDPLPPGMVREGPLVVLARRGDRVITLEEANEALEAARERDL